MITMKNLLFSLLISLSLLSCSNDEPYEALVGKWVLPLEGGQFEDFDWLVWEYRDNGEYLQYEAQGYNPKSPVLTKIQQFGTYNLTSLESEVLKINYINVDSQEPEERIYPFQIIDDKLYLEQSNISIRILDRLTY
jgi:hypothetical protein